MCKLRCPQYMKMLLSLGPFREDLTVQREEKADNVTMTSMLFRLLPEGSQEIYVINNIVLSSKFDRRF